jgi:glycosyltransferase involved in cell wall biosynthesis
MKLLFLTQVLDAEDAVLGFTSRWVAGLARHCERVRVLALRVGEVSRLPANVDWREVGRRGRLSRWLRYRRFLREALREEGFDAVLAHMVPRYALLAAGPARRVGAGLWLWYTHGGVDRRLERAARMVDGIFTASEESLRVPARRRIVTGHGVDLDHFDPRGREAASPPRLLSVGRMTPRKDPLTVLSALSILRSRGHALELDWIGAGLTAADDAFARTVREHIALGELEGSVHLSGAVPYREVPEHYHRASIVINASLTGSLDKVLLEAMASARCVLSCSDAAPGVLAPLGAEVGRLLFPPGDATRLAERIEALLEAGLAERARLGQRLREIVARDHEVDGLMARLVLEMQAGPGRRR